MLTAKEELDLDALLCFVIEGGYIQAWAIESFVTIWLSAVIIMNIRKKMAHFSLQAA